MPTAGLMTTPMLPLDNVLFGPVARPKPRIYSLVRFHVGANLSPPVYSPGSVLPATVAHYKGGLDQPRASSSIGIGPCFVHQCLPCVLGHVSYRPDCVAYWAAGAVSVQCPMDYRRATMIALLRNRTYFTHEP